MTSEAQPAPIAIVSNGMTPYRLHVHRRIVRELPQVRLFSVLTHDDASGKWNLAEMTDIGLTHFGAGEPSGLQSKPTRAVHEFRKGGRIIEFLRAEAVRAVVLIGYNDPARLRLIRWCRWHDVPCFVFGDSNIRGDRATGLRAVAKRLLLRWITGNAAGIFCCGSLGRQYFQKYGARPEQISYFPYEPDYALIQNIPAVQLQEARQRLELSEDRRRIVFSGRLVPEKRADLAIEAFQQIAERRPEWDLVLLGDGSLRGQLEASVRPKLRQRVRFMGFLPEQSWVSRVYRISDVLVLPSDYEPWALVVNEAAAAGMALVCSNVVGAAAELVREGVNGYLFPPGDVHALRERLLDVTDPQNLAGYRAASPAILDEWRCAGDPVKGLRRALEDAGVIPLE